MICRECTDAPTAPHVLAHQTFYHGRSTFRCDDAGPEAMPDIGRHRQYLFLLSVQCECIKSGRLIPECLVEFLEQYRRLLAQRGCAPLISQFVKDLSHTEPGVV